MAFIQITAAGITADSYDQILASLKQQFQSIYGSDIYIDADSKDGQFLALIALSISDTVDSTVNAYNSFSPSSAFGAALDSNVAINGIERGAATQSSCDLVITGLVGTTIEAGIASDSNNQQWLLPAKVVIPPAGSLTVTATAKDSGAIFALANSITQITTPTLGWQSVNNPNTPTVGRPIESDAQLRLRQKNSTALTSVTSFDGLSSSISKLKNIGNFKLYENDADTPDSNGLPAHSIALVVEGGDSNDIAQVLLDKKGQGVATYGTTCVNVVTKMGDTKAIHLFRPILVSIGIKITLQALSGYASTIGQEIQQKVSDYINSLGIGRNVLLTKLYLPANLCSDLSNSHYFDILSVEINRDAGDYVSSNITIAFNECAQCQPSDIQLTVQS